MVKLHIINLLLKYRMKDLNYKKTCRMKILAKKYVLSMLVEVTHVYAEA